MEKNTLHFPAQYAVVEADELVYLDGGELSEIQTKLLLGTVSAVITSFMLIPNVIGFIFEPIFSPITDAFDSMVDSIVDSIKNIFS